MKRVLFAELAVLAELKAVRIILLVLRGVVVPLFAFSAGQCNSDSHDGFPPKFI